MNKKVLQLITNTAGRLIFALLCGGAYYIIALKFILGHTSVGGGLLAFFCLPLIVCGAGLIIVKILRSQEEQENTSAMLGVFWTHVLLMLLSVVFLISL